MTKNIFLPKNIKTSPLVYLVAALLCSALAQAQESINSSGGNATGSGGNISYSIGQIFYTTNIGNEGSVAQGVQHSYELLPVGNSENSSNISFTIFPNPSTDNLILQASNFNNESLWFELLDMQGKQLIRGQIMANQTQINTVELPNATYFVHVVNQEKQKVQSFKLIKN